MLVALDLVHGQAQNRKGLSMDVVHQRAREAQAKQQFLQADCKRMSMVCLCLPRLLLRAPPALLLCPLRLHLRTARACRGSFRTFCARSPRNDGNDGKDSTTTYNIA